MLDSGAGELGYRIGNQLGVQIETDGGDVAGLGLGEDAPRAANLQVPHRKLEP